MGVKNLWQILTPVCKVISIKDLSNSRVAIDASIWIISALSYTKSGQLQQKRKNQFLYTLLKRILLLLENGITPVFVFDGRTPKIKQRELLRRLAAQNDPVRLARVMARSLMNKILDKRMAKEPSNFSEKEKNSDLEKIIDEEQEIDLSEFWEIVGKIEHADNLEREIIGECTRLLSEQGFIYENSWLDPGKFTSLGEFMGEAQSKISERLQGKYESRFSEISLQNTFDAEPVDKLKSVLMAFEASQTVKQIHSKLKDKLVGEKTDDLVRNIDQKIDPSSFTHKEHRVFESNSGREYIYLKKKDSVFYEKMKMDAGEAKQNKGKTLRKQRFDEIMKSFTNVREEGLKTVFSKNGLFEMSKVIELNRENMEDEIYHERDEAQIMNIDRFAFDANRKNSANQGFKNPFDFDSIVEQESNEYKEQSLDYPIQTDNVREICYPSSNRFAFKTLTADCLAPFTENCKDKLPIPNSSNLVENQNSKLVPDCNKNNHESIEKDYSLSQTLFPAEKTNAQNAQPINQFAEEDDQIAFLNRLNSSNPANSHFPISRQMRFNPRSFPLFSVEDELVVDRINDEGFLVKQETIAIIKHLLCLLGLKYMDAAEEAEAQCAFLEREGLVSCTITEDSDTFLFGGQRVVRNFGGFAKGKDSLELCSMAALTEKLGLNRDKLILLALLLGSDYGEGVRGVGVVNAMEVITAFENVEEFETFLKKWGDLPDAVNQRAEALQTIASERQLQFCEKHKNYKKHWIFPEGFPDRRIVSAFENPRVETDISGKALEKIGKFKMEKFGRLLKENLDLEPDKLDGLVRRFEASLAKAREVKITSFFGYNAGRERYEMKGDRMARAVQMLKQKSVPANDDSVRLKKKVKRDKFR